MSKEAEKERLPFSKIHHCHYHFFLSVLFVSVFFILIFHRFVLRSMPHIHLGVHTIVMAVVDCRGNCVQHFNHSQFPVHTQHSTYTRNDARNRLDELALPRIT